MIDKSKLGKYLKEARTAYKLTLRALEKEVGLSNAVLSQYETGKVMPTVNSLYKICFFYNTDMQLLLDMSVKDEYIKEMPREA